MVLVRHIDIDILYYKHYHKTLIIYKHLHTPHIYIYMYIHIHIYTIYIYIYIYMYVYIYNFRYRQIFGFLHRCNVGYGFVNFRTSASCDEFIARRPKNVAKTWAVHRDMRGVLELGYHKKWMVYIGIPVKKDDLDDLGYPSFRKAPYIRFSKEM